jgi:hypothetical protein
MTTIEAVFDGLNFRATVELNVQIDGHTVSMDMQMPHDIRFKSRRWAFKDFLFPTMDVRELQHRFSHEKSGRYDDEIMRQYVRMAFQQVSHAYKSFGEYLRQGGAPTEDIRFDWDEHYARAKEFQELLGIVRFRKLARELSSGFEWFNEGGGGVEILGESYNYVVFDEVESTSSEYFKEMFEARFEPKSSEYFKEMFEPVAEAFTAGSIEKGGLPPLSGIPFKKIKSESWEYGGPTVARPDGLKFDKSVMDSVKAAIKNMKPIS